MKLSDLLPFIGYMLGYPDKFFLASNNVDDVFMKLKSLKISEIEVGRGDMNLLIRFYLANVGQDRDGGQGKILKEGKLDRFMGIDLIYHE